MQNIALRFITPRVNIPIPTTEEKNTELISEEKPKSDKNDTIKVQLPSGDKHTSERKVVFF